MESTIDISGSYYPRSTTSARRAPMTSKTPTQEKTRTAVRCERCGAICIGRVWADGTVRSIGRKPCSCGETAYAAIDADDIGL